MQNLECPKIISKEMARNKDSEALKSVKMPINFGDLYVFITHGCWIISEAEKELLELELLKVSLPLRLKAK